MSNQDKAKELTEIFVETESTVIGELITNKKPWQAVEFGYKEGYLAGYTASQQESQWISIKDRLPEYESQVLLWENAIIRFGYLAKQDHWMMSYGGRNMEANPTHWMPIPSLPIVLPTDGI